MRIDRRDSKHYYYPDLQVVCEKKAPADVHQDNQVLIIEILSPSTRDYDLDEKLSANLKMPSPKCYVTMEQHTRFAIVMRRKPSGFLRETYEGTDAVIELPFIACTPPMRDIYDGIEFTATCVQEPDEAYDVD